MRLTGPQIGAGIALAELQKEYVVKAAKVGKRTLNDIIASKTTSYREDTITKIKKVIEAHGIEFIEQGGVRKKSQGVDMLVGREGLHEFFNGVHEYANENGGTIVQFGVDEKLFLDHLGKEFSADYVKRMQEVSKKRKDLKVKAIICEGETDYLAPDYNEYRWISKDIFQAVPFYICGETLAIMDFHTVPAPTIVLLKFPAITNAYRKQFEAFWSIAHEMPRSTKGKEG